MQQAAIGGFLKLSLGSWARRKSEKGGEKEGGSLTAIRMPRESQENWLNCPITYDLQVPEEPRRKKNERRKKSPTARTKGVAVRDLEREGTHPTLLLKSPREGRKKKKRGDGVTGTAGGENPMGRTSFESFTYPICYQVDLWGPQ